MRLNEPGGLQTEIEAEIAAVGGPPRIESFADCHAEAHGQTKQLVGDDVAIPELDGADGGPAPQVAKVRHATRQVILRHVLKKAVCPDVRRQRKRGASRSSDAAGRPSGVWPGRG